MHRKNNIPNTDVSDLNGEPTESSRQEFDIELDENQDKEAQEQDKQVLNLEHTEVIISSLAAWNDELTKKEKAVEEKERFLASKEKRLAGIKKEIYAELKGEQKENQQLLQKDDVVIEEEGDDQEKMQAQIKQLKKDNRELSNIITIAKEAVTFSQEQLMLANRQGETRNKLKKIHKLRIQEKERIIEEEKKKIEELMVTLKSQEQAIQRLRLEHKVLRSEIPQKDEESKELVSKHEEQFKEKIAQMQETIFKLRSENSTLTDVIRSFDFEPVSTVKKIEEEKENQVSVEFEEKEEDREDREDKQKPTLTSKDMEDIGKFIAETVDDKKLNPQNDALESADSEKFMTKDNSLEDIEKFKNEPHEELSAQDDTIEIERKHSIEELQKKDLRIQELEKKLIEMQEKEEIYSQKQSLQSNVNDLIELEEKSGSVTYLDEVKRFNTYLDKLKDNKLKDDPIYKKAYSILIAVENAKIANIASDEILTNTLFLTNQFLEKIASNKKDEITEIMCSGYATNANDLNKNHKNPLCRKIAGAMTAFLGAVVLVLQLPFIRYKTGWNLLSKGITKLQGTENIAEKSLNFLEQVRLKK